MSGLNPEIKVSILCSVFNHENYLRKCLDGILMQETSFAYEVLVHDDASTDASASIIAEYEKAYPGIVKPIYQKVNQFSKGVGISFTYQFPRAKGKYIAFCEGDDFWTDKNKLQMQFDFLESHPEYIAVTHNCVVVGEDSLPNGEKYPECKHEEYTEDDFWKDIMPGQTATFMGRNFSQMQSFDDSLMGLPLSPGDRKMYFSYIKHGKIHCIQKAMSAYRHVTDHGYSYSASYKHTFEKSEVWNRAFVTYSMKFGRRTQINATKQYLYFVLRSYLKKEVENPKEYLRSLPTRKYVLPLCVLYGLPLCVLYVLRLIRRGEIWNRKS